MEGERRNEFEGGLPEDLGKMKSLQQFSAEWVGLSGEIPKSIFSSETLEYVRIVFNEFSGTLEPEWFEGMTSLDSFYCWDNPKLFIRGYCPSNVYCDSSQILSE